MKRLILSIILFASTLFAQTKTDIEVPYVAFEIKEAKGSDSIQAYCIMCHSFGTVTNYLFENYGNGKEI